MKIINESTELVSPDKLKPHPRNPRQGDVGAIHTSIESNGFYGSVIAQKSTGYILAGNHRYLAAMHANAEQIPVTWVDVDDQEAIRILLADNRTNDLATYNDDALAELLQDLLRDGQTLDGTGFDGDDLDNILKDLAQELEDKKLNENYSRKIEAPIYTPKGLKPSEEELLDERHTQMLLKRIDKAKLPAQVDKFLRMAAQRHTVFFFDLIAEYYAHAPAEVQELMEDSALVIIDFEKAIELGYVRLAKTILRQAGEAKDKATLEEEDDDSVD